MKRAKPIRLAAISLAVLSLWGVGVAIWGTVQPSQDPICGRWHAPSAAIHGPKEDEVWIQKEGTFQRTSVGAVSSGTWKSTQAWQVIEVQADKFGTEIYLVYHVTDDQVRNSEALSARREAGHLVSVPNAYYFEEFGQVYVVVPDSGGESMHCFEGRWSLYRKPSWWRAAVDWMDSLWERPLF